MVIKMITIKRNKVQKPLDVIKYAAIEKRKIKKLLTEDKVAAPFMDHGDNKMLPWKSQRIVFKQKYVVRKTATLSSVTTSCCHGNHKEKES